MSDNFPKILYVYEDGDGENIWLCAEESIEACVSRDDSKLVGVYHLDKVVDAYLKVTSKVILKVVGVEELK